MNGFLAVLIVLGLVSALAWLLRRGSLGGLTRRGGSINVETAVALGERRSLVIVSVEGRRLLLGLTSSNISLVTELQGPRETSQLLRTNTELPTPSWELGVGGWPLTKSLGRLFRSGVSQ